MGDGTLNKNKFQADVKGGPLLNVDSTKPYTASMPMCKAGETHAVVNGAITQPFHLDRFTAGINVSGPSLSDLYFLTGLVLPAHPAYHLTVTVERERHVLPAESISVPILGSSDLRGQSDGERLAAEDSGCWPGQL